MVNNVGMKRTRTRGEIIETILWIIVLFIVLLIGSTCIGADIVRNEATLTCDSTEWHSIDAAPNFLTIRSAYWSVEVPVREDPTVYRLIGVIWEERRYWWGYGDEGEYEDVETTTYTYSSVRASYYDSHVTGTTEKLAPAVLALVRRFTSDHTLKHVKMIERKKK